MAERRQIVLILSSKTFLFFVLEEKLLNWQLEQGQGVGE